MRFFDSVKNARANMLKNRQKKQEMMEARTASELKEMKKKRLVLEQRKKTYEEYEQEQSKIKELETNLRKRTPAYRIANALLDNYKKFKKNKKPIGNLPGGDFFK